MASTDIKQSDSSPEATNDLIPDNNKTQDDLSNMELLDLDVVLKGFKQCISNDGQLYLDGYLQAYTEVNKFFHILGHVFNFIANDVEKKVTILKCYRQSGCGDYYYSIESMMKYEIDDQIIKTNQQSGSRTLLRLHRALEFITGFLGELMKAELNESLGNLTSNIYWNTLSKHHGWFTSNMVGTALKFMPTKQFLINKLTGGDLKLQEHNEHMMPKVVEVMKTVYDSTHKLYIDYEIDQLP